MSVWQNQGYHALNTWQQQNRPDFELAGKIGLQVAYLPSMVMGGSAISQIAGNFSRIGIHPVLAKDVQVAVRVLKNSTRLVNHSTRWNAFQQTVRMSSARASTLYWNIQVKSYAAGYILRDFGEGLFISSPPPPTPAGITGAYLQNVLVRFID